MSEAALMADRSLFHVRLTPMVEGAAWTSDQAGKRAGQAAGGGGDGGGHDASEL